MPGDPRQTCSLLAEIYLTLVQVLLIQVQIGRLVVSAPPMFLSAVKETEEDIETKRQKMTDDPLPPVELHALVPVETTAAKKKQQLERALVARESGEATQVVPDLKFEKGKDEKVKTKHMMVALNQSLNKLLGFRFSDTVPLHPLRPLRLGEQRVVHVNAEGQKMIYYHNPETGESTWQSTRVAGFEAHLRLTSVMDEGSSSYALFAALAETCAVLPLRDSMHKLTRVQELAFHSDEVLKELRREVFLCLKLDRAPWSTSRFGRRLKEAAGQYAESMEENDQLLSPFFTSIAKDLGLATPDFDTIKSSHHGVCQQDPKGDDKWLQPGALGFSLWWLHRASQVGTVGILNP